MPKTEILNYLGYDEARDNNWASVTSRDIIDYDVVEYIQTDVVTDETTPPWEETNLDCAVLTPPNLQADMTACEIKSLFLN